MSQPQVPEVDGGTHREREGRSRPATATTAQTPMHASGTNTDGHGDPGHVLSLLNLRKETINPLAHGGGNVRIKRTSNTAGNQPVPSPEYSPLTSHKYSTNVKKVLGASRNTLSILLTEYAATRVDGCFYAYLSTENSQTGAQQMSTLGGISAQRVQGAAPDGHLRARQAFC